MENLTQALATDLQPVIVNGIAVILSALIGWLAFVARQKLGVDIEQRHRDALHSAIMSGVLKALGLGLDPSTQADLIVDAAIDHAKSDGAADAIKALGVSDDGLRTLALSKVAAMSAPDVA